jgi:hypothetical protein
MKANVEQTVSLAKLLWAKGLQSGEIVNHLKEMNYKYNGTTFNAAAVAYVVSGLESANDGLKSGRLKFTKAKGLHLV